MSRDRRGLAALVHPVALVALAAWIANDHFLKRLHPGLVSGKLSDVACLIVVPLLAIAAWASSRLGTFILTSSYGCWSAGNST